METFKQLSLFTKATLLTGLLFIIYGYACRVTGIYFFWESRSFGWMIFIIGIIGWLLFRIKTKREEKEKAIPEKAGMWILIFVLCVQSLLMTILPFTDAYAAAKKYLANDSQLASEVGTISCFGLIPMGSIQVSSNNGVESGNAMIYLTVKGDKEYRDMVISVVKQPGSAEWVVDDVE